MKIFLWILITTIFTTAMARPHEYKSIRARNKTELKYKTSFGSCPVKTTGALTLKLIKVFEENKSLKDVKKKIVDERLTKKYFISKYRINYRPTGNLLTFYFDCPQPLMKVQIYKESDSNDYESGHDSLLVSGGDLYDPTYEVVLRMEKKLTSSLPFLALPFGEIDDSFLLELTNLVVGMGGGLKKKLSEIILNKEGELTVILSFKGSPSSVFLGPDDWGEKFHKLQRIVNYMETKNKTPLIINLTNSHKVVVKFSDKL